jgi:hypothetical protein
VYVGGVCVDAWRNEVAPERWIITVMAAIVDAE